jgi:hypothetical protein
MRKLILSSLLCLMLMPAMAQSGSQEKRISIEEFGAKPDDGKDDTKALRKAAEWCRQNRGVTLYMPQGEYRLRDAEAERLESEVLAGKMGQNPESTIFTPYYPYVKGLDFTGAEDVTIEAYGAVLMCEGWMEPLSIIETKNMTVKGLTIDYKRKPFSEGRVVEIVKGGFVVEFGPQREITDQTPLPRLMLWDNKISGIYRNPFYYAKDEFLGENRVRFMGDLPEYMMGAAVAAPHSFHFRPAVLLLRSENTLLKDLSIHSQCGMGIVGFDSKDIRMDHLSVVPADGYSFSTNTDATHFACCEGLISFDGCMFRGQGDDATNVHGYYHDIEKIEGEDVTLVLKAPTFTHAQVTDVPRVGDKMEVVKISTLEVVDELEVVEVEHEAPATDVKVRLSGKLPEKYNEYYLFNVSKLPRLEFCRSVVWGNLARGVLAKTRGVRIEDNIFRGSTGTAIHVGAESNWKEGTHAKDLTIARNVIINCGLGAGCQYGASGIAVVIGAPDTKATQLHDGVVIEGNTIIGTGSNACGISIRNAKNIRLKDNRVEQCRQAVETRSVENLIIE